jgi:PERQ amino acid-rich with GYF domain-containing protein
VDEFIQMLLTFPVEPSSSNAKVEQLEIISDSVYANSSTLDGRRFAQEFYTKRKADAQNRLASGSQAPAKINSLADSESPAFIPLRHLLIPIYLTVVKTQPKAAGSDFGGFKVVKPKGKGRK